MHLDGSAAGVQANFCDGNPVDSGAADPTDPPPGGGDDTYELAVKYAPLQHVDRGDGFYPVTHDWVFAFDGSSNFASWTSELFRSPSQTFTCVGRSNANCGAAAAEPLLPDHGSGERLDYPAVVTDRNDEQMLEYNTIQRGDATTPDQEPVVYYYRVDNSAGADDGEFTLQYWYYYTYNYFSSGALTGIFPTLRDYHEGDWEHVDITFNAQEKPIKVFMAQHSGGETCHWQPASDDGGDCPLTFAGTHVNVYAAHGDHANYPKCGSFLLIFPSVYDTTCEGGAANQATDGGDTDPTSFYDLSDPEQSQDWACWQGQDGADYGTGVAPAMPLRQGGTCPRRRRPAMQPEQTRAGLSTYQRVSAQHWAAYYERAEGTLVKMDPTGEAARRVHARRIRPRSVPDRAAIAVSLLCCATVAASCGGAATASNHATRTSGGSGTVEPLRKAGGSRGSEKNHAPPGNGLTVPNDYPGRGRSHSQLEGGIINKGCEAGDVVALFPKVRAGRTPVHVVVRGVAGKAKAEGVVARQVLWIDYTADPALGAGRLPRLKAGTYVFRARFGGDHARYPTTFTRSQVFPANC
jgi:hypothetical protein